jgi:tetratricopeptide (TPR) repeat protein
MKSVQPTPISGISYYTLPGDGMVTGLDGKVRMSLGDIPVPFLDDDYHALAGQYPSYDAVGRGIYHALRANPDCAYGETYARLLQEGYPHFLAELASHIVMLDKKDVDVAYLDRKINYLKIFAMIEPANHSFPLEIGKAYAEKGLSLATLQLATVSLYRAERYLRKALALSPDDVTVRHQLGEISYILGKYDDALSCWRGILTLLGEEDAKKLERRLARLADGISPRIPVVDYLEAVGAALALHQEGEYEEAAAILQDVLDDAVFREEFCLPQVSYILGVCCVRLGMPRYAEEHFRAALHIDPAYAEARSALAEISA